MSEAEEREVQICHELLLEFERRAIMAGRNPETLARAMVIFGGRQLEQRVGAEWAASWLAAHSNQILTKPGRMVGESFFSAREIN